MREAIDLYLEAAAEGGQELPVRKSIEQHIREGLLKKCEIADKYYLTQIEIQLPAIV